MIVSSMECANDLFNSRPKLERIARNAGMMNKGLKPLVLVNNASARWNKLPNTADSLRGAGLAPAEKTSKSKRPSRGIGGQRPALLLTVAGATGILCPRPHTNLLFRKND